MLQKCMSPVCVPALTSVKQVFNGTLEKVKVIDAYIVKPDGKIVKLAPSAILDRPTAQAEAAPSFSSLRELELKYDGFEVGDASYFKVETTTTKPTFEGRFDALEIFPLLFEWKSIEINISAPTNYPIFTEAVGLDGGKTGDADGRTKWQYRKENLKAIGYEPAMYDVTGESPRFALTTFKNANELGSTFWQKVKEKAIVTPEIQKLADEITKDITVPSQQAHAIYDWVNRNIRYLSVILDQGGWVPHSSEEIIRNGYGDCKDYTTIIHTLLKAKGIDSVPVLIRSDFGDWFPSVATAHYFNHAILYIPSLNLFADATMPNTRLGLIPQTIVGKKAVLAGERTGIITVPEDRPADNQILSEVTYKFAENGNVTGRTRNTYVGRSEILFRPIFGQQRIERDSSLFVKMILAYFGVDGDGKIISIGDPHKVGEPFVVELEAAINNFTTFLPKGRAPLPLGLNMINFGAMEGFVSVDTRKTSLMVGALQLTETVAVELPPTVTVAAAPPAVNFSNAIGSFTIKSELKDGKVRFTREFVLAKDLITPTQYAAFKELVGKMLESYNVEIDYSADPSLLQAKSKELRKSPAKPKAAPSLYDLARGDADLPEKLKPVEVSRFEKKLESDPADIDTRLRLIRNYAMFGKPTPAGEKAHLRHRLWLVNNRPEMSERDVYGVIGSFMASFPAASKEALVNAWLSQVEANRSNTKVRLNAVDFVKESRPEAADKLLVEGSQIEPDNYKFRLLLTELKGGELKKADTAERRSAAAKRILEDGKVALSLIKKERSDERDADRSQVLKRLCIAAVEAGELELASSYANELILDFGQSETDHGYDEAAHVGNITLGLVQLRRSNLEKAKEHLLIAIRAPLRQEYNALSKIDTRLAKELFDKGEKATVLEYLKLCLNLGNLKEYPESYAEEIKALKLWQEQIGKGSKPSFDFGQP
jgi:hypothetical protein